MYRNEETIEREILLKKTLELLKSLPARRQRDIEYRDLVYKQTKQHFKTNPYDSATVQELSRKVQNLKKRFEQIAEHDQKLFKIIDNLLQKISSNYEKFTQNDQFKAKKLIQEGEALKPFLSVGQVIPSNLNDWIKHAQLFAGQIPHQYKHSS